MTNEKIYLLFGLLLMMVACSEQDTLLTQYIQLKTHPKSSRTASELQVIDTIHDEVIRKESLIQQHALKTQSALYQQLHPLIQAEAKWAAKDPFRSITYCGDYVKLVDVEYPDGAVSYYNNKTGEFVMQCGCFIPEEAAADEKYPKLCKECPPLKWETCVLSWQE